jgi:hypothetical protein
VRASQFDLELSFIWQVAIKTISSKAKRHWISHF